MQANHVSLKFDFFVLKMNNFLVFSDIFNMMRLKLIFLKKINTFLNKKHFKLRYNNSKHSRSNHESREHAVGLGSLGIKTLTPIT